MRAPDIVDEIEDNLDREEIQGTLAAASRLRDHLEAELADRRLDTEDPLLAKRRRLHQRLEVLEAKARAGRFEDAEEDLEVVDEIAWQLADGLEARDRVDDAAETAHWPRATAGTWIAAREARRLVVSLPGAILAVLSLLVFSLGLQAALEARPAGLDLLWANAREPALVLAPLAGLVAGLDLVGADAREGRLPALASGNLPRGPLVLAKALGAFVALALVLAGPALLVALAGLALGFAPALTPTVAALAGLVLSATSFAALALVLETLHGRRSWTLAGTVAAYLCLGPIWETAFAAGTTGAPTRQGMAAALLHAASPIVAAADVYPPGGSLPYRPIVVLATWTLAMAGLAALLARRDGFPRA